MNNPEKMSGLPVLYRRAALPLILLLATLAGCATVPAGNTDVSVTPPRATEDGEKVVAGVSIEAEVAEDADTEAEAPLPEPEIVYGQFDPDILTRVIMAEMAGQRGFNQKALDDYLALARETNDINIIKRASRIAAFMRDLSAAREMGQMWLAKDPDSEEALRTLSFQMVTLGRYREALDYMEQLLDQGEELDFRFITSRTAMDNDLELIIDALVADFEDLYGKYPDNLSLRLGLAQLYRQNEQYQQAYDHVSELARLMKQEPDVVILEVQLLEQLDRQDEARRRLEQALANNAAHKQLRFLYGRKLVDEERYRDAREQFSIIVEQYPNDYDMLYSLALLSMEVNMLGEARQYFQSLVDAGHRLDDAHYYLGYINIQENNNTRAIEHLLNVNGGSNFLNAQRSLAELMIRTGRYLEVKSHLQNVRFRNPDYNIPLLTMEANVLMDEGYNGQASTVLNNAIGAFPNNIQLLFLRSVVSQEEGDLVLMEEDLRRIIQLNPANPVAYNHLGYYLANSTDRYDEAYELIRRAIELAPNDPAIIDSLGWVQYRLGLFDQALENLDRAYELFPDHEVAAHLGEVLWVTGEKAAANRIWRNALEVQPDSEHIRSTMERLTADPSS